MPRTRMAWLWRQIGRCHYDEGWPPGRGGKCPRNRTEVRRQGSLRWRRPCRPGPAKEQPSAEIDSLQKLDDLGAANSTDLNQLGIASTIRRPSRKRWTARLRGEDRPGAWPLFKMGLVFNDTTISQKADAAALLSPDDGNRSQSCPGKGTISGNTARVASTCRQGTAAAVGLLNPRKGFASTSVHSKHVDIRDIDENCELDPKRIQCAKNRLLQEIELNRGKVVPWLDDYPLDPSREDN